MPTDSLKQQPSSGYMSTHVTTIEDAYPLTPMQRGMLFNTLREPRSGVDIEQIDCALHEVLDVAAFKRGWEYVVARHPVLRTSLRWKDLGEPRQDVHAQVELPWEEQDWSGTAESARDERLRDFLSADRRRGFDLTRAPLFRLTMVRIGEAEAHVIWTVHHSVLDGQSLALVLREAFAAYEANCQGREISLPLPRPYRAYVDWLQEQDFTKSEAFWRKTLSGFTAATPLVVDHAPNLLDDDRARKEYREILLTAQTTSALRALAQHNGFTLNTIIQGAWALLLSRYSGETDVVFGVIRAARRSTIEGAETMVGLFITTLPLRVLVRSEIGLTAWLKEIRQQWLAMREHEQTPLVSVQASSEVPAQTPLFQSTVVFEESDLNGALGEHSSTVSGRGFRQFSQTNYPLDLAAYDGRELRLRIDFDRSRIDADAAGRIVVQMRTLLDAIAINPEQKVGGLPLLTQAERHQLLIEWNRTAVEYASKACVHELFELQAERTPDRIAVKFEDRQVTYRELNRRSNQLARHLWKLGVGPDALVGVCAERSVEMVIAVLGILKAGGAYVPIDPAYPHERVAFMVKDAGAFVLLTQEHLIPTLPELEAGRIVNLSKPDWTISPEDGKNLPATAINTNLAYVIYTSGSTGQPKGAMIPHGAIVNHLQWMQSMFLMSEHDCVLQKTEFSFDVSAWELFAPLVVGAQLVLARPNGHQDPGYLVDTIIQHRVTVLQLVPSLLRMLLEEPRFKTCDSLRHIFCGGETMREDIPRRVFGILNAELHNMYGPTEAAIDSLHYTVPRDYSGGMIPIGRPVPNTHAYVLDHHREPVPIGVPGELYLGGVQVGRGYHNRPELTGQCFVPDRFSNRPDARLYKTGDRVRFLADGNIEFLGRIDEQVKVRGFRIELGEVSSTLQQHPAVRDCVVAVREDVPADKQLVAYVIPTSSSTARLGELRNFAKQRLPVYMVPSAFVFLEDFPLFANGKVDRRRLPVPERRSLEPAMLHIEPRTAMEEALVDIWREVLDVDRVSVRGNFFELGGDSLLLVQLVNEINWALQVSVGVPDIIQNPTIEETAQLLDGWRETNKRLSRVVAFRESSAAPSVYFIYAGLSELRLAQCMGDKHSVYGIEARWPLKWRSALTSKRESAYPRMEELVAPYVDALEAHCGSAPCVLVGLSFAGLMAFEAAHQLQKRGGKVDVVVVVDTAAVPPNPFRVAWHMWQQRRQQPRKGPATNELSQPIDSQAQGSSHTAWWLLGRAMNRVWSFFRPAAASEKLSGISDEEGMPLPWALLDRLYTEIDKSYQPRRLDSRGVLIRTEESSVRAYDDSLGWRRLFRHGLEIRSITGDHTAIFREQIPALAREISDVLERRPHRPDRLLVWASCLVVSTLLAAEVG